ncbi:MAG: FAD-dependent oxidoreductase [Lactobacillus sp.]|uniref:FAD-dependent oxidoreductase n=1 Tax=Lacticaseibacillus suilingensis TaxID=2799577 RepID=A0ABW4BF00_9LACO|nr:FAD-dependent oxidoreductase [Lacticaseibacillus suilingensis]MCI1894182.1 FAD-dependent oxidoreductase [Lactobacillus sp.]MCI1941594.1 FAD-dependent oxidoreductase [Lactobacillus sp.]MCI1972140.1 FAD-dependent oxidoreductase [Lactobacillus sp.]
MTQSTKDYDVIVVGGGPSGTMAAVAAGRNGARVLLIDQAGFLGGSLTSMGVGPMMTFFAGEKQVIKGLAQELIDRLVAQGFSPGHVPDATNYVSYNTPFDSEGLKLTLDAMTQEAGVEVLFHTMLVDVAVDDGEVQSLTVANEDGLTTLTSHIFIDATGNADLALKARVPFQLGREEDNLTQPMTLNMKLYNVDTDEIRRDVLAHQDRFPRAERDLDAFNNAARVAVSGYEEEFRRARENGELSIPRKDLLFFETNTPGEYIVNATRILNHGVFDAKTLSDAEIQGRIQCHELFVWLRKTIPGFEDCRIEFTGPNIGVRQSRQIRGTYYLTAEDFATHKQFASTIAHTGYPMDIHSPQGSGYGTPNDYHESKPSEFDRSKLNDYHDIPFEVMTTPAYKNLAVTGRCISVDFNVQASVRTTPTVMALGQACGTAAAQVVNNDTDLTQLDVQALRQTLKEQGAYLD